MTRENCSMISTPHFQSEDCEFESLREQKEWKLFLGRGKKSSVNSLNSNGLLLPMYKQKKFNLIDGK